MSEKETHEELKERIHALEKAVAEHKQRDTQLQKHCRYLESMDRVSQVIRKAADLEHMMWEVMDAVLMTFQCDRAWLLYPCDPHAPFWRVPVERTRPEYPGANSMNINVPMTPDVAEIFQTALDSDEPVMYGPGGRPLAENTKSFGVQSQMSMAIHPRLGNPWQFGMHQCSHARSWTGEEKTLFNDIGHRLADALSNLLYSRDLQLSKAALLSAYDDLEKRVEERNAELVEANKQLVHEIDMRRQTETENEQLISELRTALDQVKKLSGFLPICASCKKIRDDKGYWNQIEEYIRNHSEAEFSHSICPECSAKLYPRYHNKK